MSSYKNKTNTPYFRINHRITASTVRLIDAKAKQIGVLTLSQALQMAQDNNTDLVEIAPKAKPPVVKLISFTKFKYQQAKKMKAEKKGDRGGDLKEIQAQPFIGEGDYQTKLSKAKKFFNTGNKVKISIKFLGRQITHKEFGYNLVERFKTDFGQLGVPEGESKLIGKRLITIFAPVKKSKKTNEKTE
jgi:translation initiation factor IF-3